MSIIDHIQYLVSRHDCVVVAGLGAFVSQHIAAQISSDGLMLLPPSRVLVFNNVISHDDGLLAGSIARREGISYDAARDEINRQVELLRNRIETEGHIDIPRIGRFEPAEGSSLIFTPAENGVVNMAYSSLPALKLPGDMREETPQILEVYTVNPTPHRSVGQRLIAFGKYAAAVALLVGIGITVSTPIILDNRPVDQASLSIPKVTPAKAAVLPTASVVAEQPAKTAEVAENLRIEPSVLTIPEVKGNPEEDYSCFIIVASCASRKEADRFVSRNGGNDKLRVINSDGRYRVYAAVSNDYDQAFDYKTNHHDFKSLYPSAWVYERK